MGLSPIAMENLRSARCKISGLELGCPGVFSKRHTSDRKGRFLFYFLICYVKSLSNDRQKLGGTPGAQEKIGPKWRSWAPDGSAPYFFRHSIE